MKKFSGFGNESPVKHNEDGYTNVWNPATKKFEMSGDMSFAVGTNKRTADIGYYKDGKFVSSIDEYRSKIGKENPTGAKIF